MYNGTAEASPMRDVGGTNFNATTPTWSGNHAAIQAIQSITDPIMHRGEWSYGSGSVNRPLSRKCLFCIKF